MKFNLGMGPNFHLYPVKEKEDPGFGCIWK